MNSKAAIFWGALLVAAAVALGAYGAHGLQEKLVALDFEKDMFKRLDWFETAVKYHMYHSIGMIVIGLLAARREPSRLLKIAPALFLVGIVLFCGSLYAMTVLSTSWSKLGAIVPIGGASFIAGWILLALGSHNNREER